MTKNDPQASNKDQPIPTVANDQIQAKTGMDDKKVNEWQKKWLAMPATRKKYEKLADAPEVVGEELFAMTNDIVDFMQGEKTGQSNLFKKINEKGNKLFKNLFPAKEPKPNQSEGGNPNPRQNKPAENTAKIEVKKN